MVHICTYNSDVGFEWNREKARANLRKHGVDFAEVAEVFEDPHAMTRPDEDPDEERSISIGNDGLGRVVVVCWTWRDDDIQIISARKATRREREQYEEGRRDA